MYIRIIKANKNSYWYSKHIGKYFHVKNTCSGYKVDGEIHPEFDSYPIDKDDVEVISLLGRMVRVNQDDREAKKGMKGLVFSDPDGDGDVRVAFPREREWLFVESRYLDIIEPPKLSVRIGDVDVVNGNVIEIDRGLGLIVESINDGEKILAIVYLDGSRLTSGWDDLTNLLEIDRRVTAVYKGMEAGGYGWYPDGLRNNLKWRKEKTVIIKGETYTREFYETLKKEFEND